MTPLLLLHLLLVRHCGIWHAFRAPMLLSAPFRLFRRRLSAIPIIALVAVADCSTSASGQQNWRWVNPVPGAVAWKDVAFGNGVYVVVGADATIATSLDGNAWTLRRMSTARATLNGVAYANGQFIAVGKGTPSSRNAALVMTSLGGIIWTVDDAMAAMNIDLFDIAHGGGTWVMVGGTSTGAAGRRVLTSTDGQTWVSRVAPGSAVRGAITYGEGRFVICDGFTTVTSTDGVTWAEVTLPLTIPEVLAVPEVLGAVAFGGGKFLALGGNELAQPDLMTVFTSLDGLTWTRGGTVPRLPGYVSMAAAASGYLAAGGPNVTYPTLEAAAAANVVFRSLDGVSWTTHPSAIPVTTQQNLPINAVVHAGTQFFVLGDQGSIANSADGTTWTRRDTGPPHNLYGVVHDGRRFIATGASGVVLTSSDGLAWTQLSTNTTSALTKLATDGTRYVSRGSSGILHSTDLVTWSPVPGSESWGGVIYGNGRFVVAPRNTPGSVHTSGDGVTWSSHNPVGDNGDQIVGLSSGDGTFVMISSGFSLGPSPRLRIYSSSDAVTWTERTPANLPASSRNALQWIAYGSGRFVILDGTRSLASTDGITWRFQALPTFLSELTHSGAQFIARSVDYGARYFGSADGITWTPVPNSLTTSLALNGYAFGGDVVVGVGPFGAILRADRAAGGTAGRIVNLSIRTNAGTGSDTLIVGLGVGGAGSSGGKPILFRGVGPSLSAFGVNGALADPVLTLFRDTTQIDQNDDWNGTFDFASVGAFALSGATPRDAGLHVPALTPDTYSIQIIGKNNATGIALAEIYDATPAASFTAATPRLVNVSARTQVGTGESLLIAGFAITGSGPVRVLIRAVGPTLPQFGVSGTLADPKLEIYRDGAKTAENDNWGGTAELKAAFSSVAAFDFSADNSRDAALVATLAPGTYTAQVSGVGDTAGVALIEVYELP